MSVDLRLRHDRSLQERAAEMFERGRGYVSVARGLGVRGRGLNIRNPVFSCRLATQYLVFSGHPWLKRCSSRKSVLFAHACAITKRCS